MLMSGLKKQESLLVIVAVTTYLMLVIYGASEGVRGSDQYWYLADIKALISGAGIVSNNVYPVSIFNGADLPRPFIHNVLYVYLSAVPGYLVGPYAGAIVINLLSGLITAFFIYLLVCRLTTHRLIALIVSIVFLLSPLTYWLSINVLSEAAMAPLVMASVFTFVTAGDSWQKWLIGTILMGLLFLSRGSFLLLFILIPFFYLIQNLPLSPRKIVFSSLLFVGIVSFWWVSNSIIEHNASCSFVGLLNMAIPGVSSNMDCFFNIKEQEINLSLWWDKALYGLKKQFLSFDISGILFYWPVNLMSAIAFYFVYKKYSNEVVILSLYAIAILALHLITIVLVQNQFRYLMVVAPISFTLLGVFLGLKFGYFEPRKWIVAVTVLVFAFMTVNITFARIVREQAHTDAIAINQLLNLFNQYIRKEESILVDMELSKLREAIILGYCLDPRITLFVTNEYSDDEYRRMLRRINAKWLITKEHSPITEKIHNVGLTKIRDLPAPYQDMSLYLMTGHLEEDAN